MSQDGKAPRPHSILSSPLAWMTARILQFPRGVLVIAVFLAVASMVYTHLQLGFRTSRLDLLNPDSGYNKLWIQYIEEFGDDDDVVVVVEGSGREDVAPVMDELALALAREQRLFHAVLHEVDLSKIREKGLHYLSAEEWDRLERMLGQLTPVMEGHWAQLNLGQIIANIELRLRATQQTITSLKRQAVVNELARLADSLLLSLSGHRHFGSPWQGMGESLVTLSQVESEFLLTNGGQLGFVLLRLSDDEHAFAQDSESIVALRKMIAIVQLRHPEVQIGLTGLPVIEDDEMQASRKDTLRAGIVSLVGVAFLFIAGFGGIRHPLLTVSALLLALAWSFGYVTLFIGHLNILSMSFGVILIGLGIDFGVHYVARYLQLRRHTHCSEAALIDTARGIGPGVITGGITTAIAFFTAGLTDFTGIAELGVIAGGGVVLCVISAMIVLPALIHLADRRRPRQRLPETFQIDRWLAPLLCWPRAVLLLLAIPCALISMGAGRLGYDHNLLNLQPAGLESVQWERKLLTETDQSLWYALSIAESPEELLRRKRQFQQLASVDRTEEIVSLLPAHHPDRGARIGVIQQRLAALPERPPLIPTSHPDQLGRQLAEVEQLLSGGDSALRRVRRQLERIRDMMRRMPTADCYAGLSDYQQGIAGDLLSRLYTLRSMANPAPPQLSDLPHSLVTRFVGKSNRFLLKIYGRGDIWDMHALETFVVDVKGVDPEATGKPVQTYFASRQMQQSYIHAGLYALIAILIVLVIDFRDLGHVALAVLPMSLGMLLMFGTMGWLQMPLNPANMIVLPLILGIGIDDGVHVVHDYRRQAGKYRLSGSTSAAIVLTSLTTMVGFGSLMLAGHQGLQSLGRVLVIGVTFCMLTSLLMLPAILSLLSRSLAPEAADDQAVESPPGEKLVELEKSA